MHERAGRQLAPMLADLMSEGDVLGHRSDPDEIDTELSDKLVERDKRDGIGEPTINLPPD